MSTKTGYPQDSWSLDDLAFYVRTAMRRNAVEAWHTGNALRIAEARLKEREGFEEWVKKNIGISKATAWRYRQIAKTFSHEDVQRRTLQELYDEMELVKAVKKAEAIAGNNDDVESAAAPLDDLDSLDAAEVQEESWTQNSSAAAEDTDLPQWATQPIDRLEDDDADFDIITKCVEFIQTLDQYQSSGEWTASDEEYVEQLRRKLAELTASVSATLKLLTKKKVA